MTEVEEYYDDDDVLGGDVIIIDDDDDEEFMEEEIIFDILSDLDDDDHDDQDGSAGNDLVHAAGEALLLGSPKPSTPSSSRSSTKLSIVSTKALTDLMKTALSSFNDDDVIDPSEWDTTNLPRPPSMRKMDSGSLSAKSKQNSFTKSNSPKKKTSKTDSGGNNSPLRRVPKKVVGKPDSKSGFDGDGGGSGGNSPSRRNDKKVVGTKKGKTPTTPPSSSTARKEWDPYLPRPPSMPNLIVEIQAAKNNLEQSAVVSKISNPPPNRTTTTNEETAPETSNSSDNAKSVRFDGGGTSSPNDATTTTDVEAGGIKESHHPTKDDEDDSTSSEIVGGKGDVKKSSSWAISSRVQKMGNSAHSALFGDKYSYREALFAIFAGVLMAFNNGMVNGSCLSGLVARDGQVQSVSGFTSHVTRAGLYLAEQDIPEFGYQMSVFLSYMLGAFISGLMTPNATPYQFEPTYGPTFLIGGCFCLTSSILAYFERDPRHVFYFAAAANGIQNGIASIYSANLIRCTLSGATTDIALAFAQVARGNNKPLYKGIVITMIVTAFWLGGFVSFYSTNRYLASTLFFNTSLFFFIGMTMVIFLVKEVGVSVQAAIFGTWKWKEALTKLGSLSENRGTTLMDMFDEIDDDGNGYIEPDELLQKLMEVNFKISAKEIKMLIANVDADGDGCIDREEWEELVHKMLSK